jgi:hypothetical protein
MFGLNNNAIPKERREGEAKIFSHVFQSLQNTIRQGNDTRDGLEFSAKEKEILYSINNTGLLEGVAAGVVSFLFLRKGRSYLVNRFVASVARDRAKAAAAEATILQPSTRDSMFDATVQRYKNPSPFSRWFGIVIDAAVSFFVAASVSTSVFYSRGTIDKVTDIPLWEGNSQIAKICCPVVIQNLQQLYQQNSENKELLDDPQTLALQKLVAFGTNCQARVNLMGSFDAVVISPGVPKPIDTTFVFDSTGSNSVADWIDTSSADIMTKDQPWSDETKFDDGK